jgi:hypothetical protein
MRLLHTFSGFNAAALHKHDAQPLRQTSKPCGVDASRAPHFCAHLALARSTPRTALQQECGCA